MWRYNLRPVPFGRISVLVNDPERDLSELWIAAINVSLTSRSGSLHGRVRLDKPLSEEAILGFLG